MRLSKFLSLSVAMSRNQAKFFIRKGRVSVGGNLVTDPNLELSDTSDIIFDGKRISIIPYSYILLHKPKSYVCVTRKSDYTSVLELLKSRSEDRYYHFANVLDADLTGMVLLSDNAHWTTRMRRKLQSKMCVYQVGLKQAFNEIQLNKISEAVLAHSEGQIGAAIYIQKEDEKTVLLTTNQAHIKEIMNIFSSMDLAIERFHLQKIGRLSLDNLSEGDYLELSESDMKI